MFSLEKLLDVRLLLSLNLLLSFGFCLVSFPPFFPWLVTVLLCCQMSNIQNLSDYEHNCWRFLQFVLVLCVWCLIEMMGTVAICRQTFVKGLEPFVKWLEEAEEEE